MPLQFEVVEVSLVPLLDKLHLMTVVCVFLVELPSVFLYLLLQCAFQRLHFPLPPLIFDLELSLRLDQLVLSATKLQLGLC